jgi:threonylcarbamoyladenosine tRNA methylthiotransferase MtaB
MPAVDGAAIRERAARLRKAGEDAVARHLSAEIGQTREVLMESPRLGRTPGFAEVLFDANQPPGEIVAAQITGRDGAALTARTI